MILPKQWKHWCRDQHLKPTYPGRGRGSCFYLQGRGHYWRVNCNGDLQIGEPYDGVLYTGKVWWSMNALPIPKTRKEFRHVVKELLAEKPFYFDIWSPFGVKKSKLEFNHFERALV